MVPPELVATVSPGSVISGKYRVEQPIGVGGMGIVLAARHLELNHPVAIKVLLPSAVVDNEATARFLREGRSAAQLGSPHVAKVHDTGRLPSGEPYLVMELLHGVDLRVHLEQVGRVGFTQAAEWALQAAHALAEAHARNIIHRDVKPANLFLAATSTGPQIKVLDFGISKQLDAAEVQLTNTTSAVGTPRYMAPEQMRSARFADARGDIWSLGIVLYELTTGQPPFHGDSITALCFDVMERTPVPPSQLNPELPAAFDALIARCLEKDPNDRFQSMEAFAAALLAIAKEARSPTTFSSAMLAASSAPFATPQPAGSTPVAAGAGREAHTVLHIHPVTKTFPLAQPLLPELPVQQTMQSWNTSAPARPASKRTARAGLLALGIGIGFAIAAGVMLLVDRDSPSASTPGSPAAPAPVESGAAPTVPASPSITPAAPATSWVAAPLAEAPLAAPPPPSASAPARSPEPAASSAPIVKPPRVDCTPPYTTDARGHRHAKPHCL